MRVSDLVEYVRRAGLADAELDLILDRTILAGYSGPLHPYMIARRIDDPVGTLTLTLKEKPRCQSPDKNSTMSCAASAPTTKP